MPHPPDISTLERLPLELTQLILKYIVPSGLNIEIVFYRTSRSKRINMHVKRIKGKSASHPELEVSGDAYSRDGKLRKGFHSSILRVNKSLSREAHAILYSQNKFTFVLGGPNGHVPSPVNMFGLLPPSAVREMKYISLRISTSVSESANPDPFSYRLRACVRHLVRVINDCDDNPAKRSLLDRLTLTVGDDEYWPSWKHPIVQSSKILPLAFAFKEPIQLKPVNNISVYYDTGDDDYKIPEWLAVCLKVSMCERRRPAELQWPTVRPQRAFYARYMQMPPPDLPAFNWQTFAVEYGVYMPLAAQEVFREQTVG